MKTSCLKPVLHLLVQCNRVAESEVDAILHHSNLPSETQFPEICIESRPCLHKTLQFLNHGTECMCINLIMATLKGHTLSFSIRLSISSVIQSCFFVLGMIC